MNTIFALEPSQLNTLGASHTAREIAQQTKLWKTLADLIQQSSPQLESFLAPLFTQNNLKIIFTGAGTSAFIGNAIADYLNQQHTHAVNSIPSTDLVSSPQDYLQNSTPTLLVSFARSGNSPESLAAVNLVDEQVTHSFHLFITCNKEGELAKIAHHSENKFCLLMPEEANDQSFAMTSSYSCMYLSALHLFDRQSVQQQQTTIDILADQGERLLQNIRTQLPMDKPYQRLVFLGSGSLQSNAQEAALKCMELTAGKIVASFDSSLGFRHGPKFIVNEHTLVVVMRSNNPYTQKYDDDIIDELCSDNIADVLVLNPATDHANDRTLTTISLENSVELDDVYLGLLWVCFAQVYGFNLAIKFGLSPDNPCPSGEVNRVVQGVTIHSFDQETKTEIS